MGLSYTEIIEVTGLTYGTVRQYVYQIKNDTKHKARTKKYYEDNKTKIRAWQKDYYYKNQELIINYMRDYRYTKKCEACGVEPAL